MTSATPWVGMATTTSSAPVERLVERRGRLETVGEAHVGQVHGVRAAGLHLARERRIARPQAHGVPDAPRCTASAVPQLPAPSTAACFTGAPAGRCGARCRSTSRARLERCRNTMTAAAPSAAADRRTRRVHAVRDRPERDRRHQAPERDEPGGPHRGDEEHQRRQHRPGRQHREDAARRRHALAAAEAQPHRIDVTRRSRQARRRRARHPRPSSAAQPAPSPRPSPRRAASPAIAALTPLVRRTFAAPTLPLPARRMSMPSSAATAGTRTGSTRAGIRSRSRTAGLMCGALRRQRRDEQRRVGRTTRREPALIQRHVVDGTSAGGLQAAAARCARHPRGSRRRLKRARVRCGENARDSRRNATSASRRCDLRVQRREAVARRGRRRATPPAAARRAGTSRCDRGASRTAADRTAGPSRASIAAAASSLTSPDELQREVQPIRRNPGRSGPTTAPAPSRRGARRWRARHAARVRSSMSTATKRRMEGARVNHSAASPRFTAARGAATGGRRRGRPASPRT